MTYTDKDEVRRLREALIHMSREIDQTLGKALHYPAYVDDQKNFPSATEADGVCTGENTPHTLAMEAADRIKSLEEALEWWLRAGSGRVPDIFGQITGEVLDRHGALLRGNEWWTNHAAE